MLYTEGEICAEYRQAKDRNAQVNILSQLNGVSTQEIIDILKRNGEIPGLPGEKRPSPKMRGKRIDWAVMDREVERLAVEGLSAVQIAERLGIDVQAIYSRRKSLKREAKQLCKSEAKPVTDKTEETMKNIEEDKSEPKVSADGKILDADGFYYPPPPMEAFNAFWNAIAELTRGGYEICRAEFDAAKSKVNIEAEMEAQGCLNL